MTSLSSTSRKLAIVPAFNESAAIARVVAEIRTAAPDFDVLVVDDASTDDTAAGASAAGAIVVRAPFNLGIGGAMQIGYQYAREHDYAMAVQVDGDGQHDPHELHKLVARLESEPKVGMVYGSRFLAGGGEGFKSSGLRRVGIKLFASMLSVITRQRVTDPTSGFRLCDRRTIEFFAHDYPHDYPEVEAILMMHAHRLRSAEVPVVMRARDDGTSSITFRRSVYYMLKVSLAVFIGLFRAPSFVEPEPGDTGRSAPA